MTTRRSLPMINVRPSELSIVDDLSLQDGLTLVQEITIVPDPAPRPTDASRRVMALLADGVPLSLLCDLADPSGPPSGDIASSELSDSHRSVLGDLLTFRAAAAEGAGPAASARRALRNLGHLRLG